MPIPAWSHSSLDAVDTCGRQYEEVRLLKHYKQATNAAQDWGNRAHKAGEDFIRDKTPLPSEFSQYAPYFIQFIGRPGTTWVEREMALDINLQPCDYWAKEVWCRGKIDVLTVHGAVAKVDDHKFGKNRKKDMQQLRVFALLVFYHHPEVQMVDVAFHWVQHGFDEAAKDRETFYRHQINEMWLALTPRIQQYYAMHKNGIFPPKPSGLCRKHCPVDSCEYHGVGRR